MGSLVSNRDGALLGVGLGLPADYRTRNCLASKAASENGELET